MSTKADKKREALRAWNRANPERRAAINKRAHDKRTQRIMAGTYARPGYPVATRPCPPVCEACGKVPEKTMNLDHNHATGEFRGWLCGNCNRGLGLLGDSLEGVEAITAYLKRK